jgi:lauroyl/myristoyl acyltransferase
VSGGRPPQTASPGDGRGTVAASAAPRRWHAHGFDRARYYRLAGALAWLPRGLRRGVAARLARVLVPWFPAERAAVRRNLARIHPERDAAWLDAATLRVFERFAACWADRLVLDRQPGVALRGHVAGVDAQLPTRAALAEGRGVVSLTAHLGNWALAGRALALLGRPVHVVMAPEADPVLGARRDRRRDPGVRVVRLTSPLVGVGLVAALRRGEVVAFQLDRALGGRGDVPVPFFGAPAPFPLGPFLTAAAAGAAVVLAFCVLGPAGGYHLAVEPALSVTRGNERAALGAAVAVLERHVRAHWDQWFNFYDVWEAA